MYIEMQQLNEGWRKNILKRHLKLFKKLRWQTAIYQ